VQYQRLKVEEHAELAVEKLGTGYVQQMDEKARGAHEKKLLELRRRCAERCDQTKHATTLTHASAHHGAGCPHRCAERYDQTTLVGWLQARLALCHKYFDAVTFPMRCAEKQNRLVVLLHWDTFAFALCVLIFLILSVWSYWAREEIAAEADGRILKGQPLLHTLLVIGDMMSIFSDSFWDDWHTQITFQIVKVIFSLSAVPFFLFTIGPLSKLFSHTDATAYMPDGRLTVPDPNGLSAYLRWIREDVLGPHSAHAEELETRFSQKEVLNLRRAVKNAERTLKEAWRKPASAIRVTRNSKLALDKMLLKLVSKERASKALYTHCFPDRVLLDEYEKNKILRIQEQKNKE
jgi:hypothetical protein